MGNGHCKVFTLTLVSFVCECWLRQLPHVPCALTGREFDFIDLAYRACVQATPFGLQPEMCPAKAFMQQYRAQQG
jgi:hypothetical protein